MKFMKVATIRKGGVDIG